MIAREALSQLASLVDMPRVRDTRQRQRFDKDVRCHGRDRAHRAHAGAGVDQRDRRPVAVADEYRLVDREQIEQRGQRRQGLDVHVVWAPRR